VAFTAFASAPASAEPAVRKRSWIALVLLLPGILYLLLFFITPLISLVFTSFQQPVINGDIGQYSAGSSGRTTPRV
jgi:spermidine/putrescine transport system permease protein